MQKYFKVVVLTSALFTLSCNRDEQKTPPPEVRPSTQVEFIPVTDFILGQLNEVAKSPVTPLKIDINGSRKDSTWIKREDVKKFAEPFLHPVIDSASMAEFFEGKSFLDQTINAYTFSYDAKSNLPDSIKLHRWDVYIDPQKNNIQRVYLVKEDSVNSHPATVQLTWKTGRWYSIRTITQLPGKDPDVKEEIIKWDFNE